MPEEVELESMAVLPFEGLSDWCGDDVVVTFETMTHNLWTSWKSQCVSRRGDVELVETEEGNYTLEGDTDRKVDPEEFDGQKVMEPGAYRDKTREEGENNTETYTIIVPKSFLTPELCEKYIEKLNKKYNRNYSLKIKEKQKSPVADLKRIKYRFEREDEEVAEKIEIIIDEL